MVQNVQQSRTPWGGEPQNFGDLLATWIKGPTLEARAAAIFAMVGKKISSDEASVIWHKLIENCRKDLQPQQLEQLTRQLIALSPEYKLAQQHYVSLMTCKRTAEPAPSLVFMITSCLRYLDKARAVKERIEARGGYARIFIGDATLLSAEERGDVVALPVPDSYEALTKKVLEGVTWIRQTYGSVSVAKVDDDMRFSDRFDPELLAGAAATLQYAGQPWGGVCDRLWHLGKTTEYTPLYGRRQRNKFAYGPLYLLGPKAVDQLVQCWIKYPGEAEGRFYEDRAIGEILAEVGITIQSFPIVEMGGMVDDTERLIPASGT